MYKRQPLDIPAGLELFFRKQVLSLVVQGDHIFVTCPDSNQLVTWNKNGTFHAATEIGGASSLSVSKNMGGAIVGTSNPDGKLWLAKAIGPRLEVSELNWTPTPTSSHSLLIS